MNLDIANLLSWARGGFEALIMAKISQSLRVVYRNLVGWPNRVGTSRASSVPRRTVLIKLGLLWQMLLASAQHVGHIVSRAPDSVGSRLMGSSWDL
jgi:hypothetical protein